MSTRRSTRHSQCGYSLAEMLVVVAIIGVLALVTIPNFAAMYRSNMLKTSLRQFASDVRGARQRAVTTYSQVRVTFSNDTAPGSYRIMQFNGTTWDQVGPGHALQQRVYFHNVSFTDSQDADSWPDIVFRPDGTAIVAGGEAKVQVKMDSKIAKPMYEVSVRTTGKVSTQ